MAAGSRSNCDDPSIPHGIEGYRRYRCRGPVCRAANAQAQREYRAAAKAEAEEVTDNVRPLQRRASKSVAAVPELEPEVPGFVEQSVIDVCATSPLACERPDLVTQARVLARFMDNPNLLKDTPGCSRQLAKLMAELRPVAKNKSKGHLVSIQRMTNRRPINQVAQGD